MAATLYGLFVASRVLHAAVYLSGRQPVRSAAWFLGVVTVVVMVALIVWNLVRTTA